LHDDLTFFVWAAIRSSSFDFQFEWNRSAYSINLLFTFDRYRDSFCLFFELSFSCTAIVCVLSFHCHFFVFFSGKFIFVWNYRSNERLCRKEEIKINQELPKKITIKLLQVITCYSFHSHCNFILSDLIFRSFDEFHFCRKRHCNGNIDTYQLLINWYNGVVRRDFIFIFPLCQTAAVFVALLHLWLFHLLKNNLKVFYIKNWKDIFKALAWISWLNFILCTQKETSSFHARSNLFM
jgi:hypothetical protein